MARPTTQDRLTQLAEYSKIIYDNQRGKYRKKPKTVGKTRFREDMLRLLAERRERDGMDAELF